MHLVHAHFTYLAVSGWQDSSESLSVSMNVLRAAFSEVLSTFPVPAIISFLCKLILNNFLFFKVAIGFIGLISWEVHPRLCTFHCLEL